MINVYANPREYSLRIEGHANYDEKGKDIVCASISILFYTWADVIEKNSELIKENSMEIEINEGNSKAKCKPLKDWEVLFSNALYTVLLGINKISENYPEYVRLNFE